MTSMCYVSKRDSAVDEKGDFVPLIMSKTVIIPFRI